ncbi:DUF2309 family protein [Telmatocola sphagniphila]|uniref:DUF2309 family protein n=1 Tax=Telmatocola sphagniphila TaxID=1123043 RepID=A0A8E6BA21_9BACT|nr:DUF2309 family protein [Telmatocola sphagniphila]
MGIMLKLEKPNLTLSSDRSSVPLSEKISRAANVLAPVWPLKTIIACNPLLELEDLPFEEAVKKSTGYHSLGKLAISGREAVNREIIKWLAAFLDEGQAAIAMPNRERGFYRTFVDLAKYDRQLK